MLARASLSIGGFLSSSVFSYLLLNRSCDSRKYTYFFPSYMLIPPKPGSGLHSNLKKCSASDLVTSHSFWSSSADNSPQEDLRRKREWRASPEHMDALRAAARRYEKSHNFHNFTVGLEFSDRTTTRHMKTIEVREPLLLFSTF
jgi:tRNA pseudouridine38-40 synthase